MSIDLLGLASQFRPLGDCESQVAWFKTLVPWVGPQAYLNIVYKPAQPDLLSKAACRLRFPPAVVDFLTQHNGAMLFSGALNLYGVVAPGRLLNREDRFLLPPFNIEWENSSWSLDPDRLLVVGGYKFDGSRVCIDRSDGTIYVFTKKQQIATASWSTFGRWLDDEIVRLLPAFASDGRMIAPGSETGPPGSTAVDEN
jgi:hypothetical protein